MKTLRGTVETRRIEKCHERKIRSFLSNYHERSEWTLAMTDGDKRPLFTATKRLCDIVHAFEAGLNAAK